MGRVRNQVRSEIRQLPFTLGKLAGALMAVIGFPGVIIISNRRPGPSWPDILPLLALGIVGVAVFVFSSRLLKRKAVQEETVAPTSTEKTRISILSWAILLAVAGIFILIVNLLLT